MISNTKFPGARLVRIEYGVVADFTEARLPYTCPNYLMLVFRKGKEEIKDVWKVVGNVSSVDLTTFLNKIVQKKEGDWETGSYTFTDGTVIHIT